MPRHLLMLSGLASFLFAGTAFAQPPDMPPGGTPGGPPGGFPRFEMPQPGKIFFGMFQDQLKLTDDQKKEIAKVQIEVDNQLAKILTAEQKKALKEPFGKGGFGPPGGPPGGQPGGFGPPPGGFGPPPGGGKGGFGPPGGFGGMGDFGGKSSADIKKQLGATDEEWKVISPKLDKVTSARRVLTGAPASGPFGGTNIVSQARAELKTVLDDPQHKKADVAEKIAAVHKAREQAHANLDAAQRELKQLLTPSQEAILISLGHLE